MDPLFIKFGNIRLRHIDRSQDYLSVVLRTIHQGSYILGNQVIEFEQDLVRVLKAQNATAIGVANGSDALRIAIEVKKEISKVERGEVILAANTYYAAASSILLSGLTPSFFDVSLNSRFPEKSHIDEVVSPNTVGVLKSHLYGGADVLDYSLYFPNIWVINDASQAHGTTIDGRFLSQNETTTYSFYPTKNLGALGDGGAIMVFDRDEKMLVEQFRNQGLSLDRSDHVIIGFNSRLDELQAGFLLVNLKHLVLENQRRQEIYDRYKNNLKHLGEQINYFEYPENVCPTHHLIQIRVKGSKAEELITWLEAYKIVCARHYPKPLHLQKAFSSLGYQKGDFPNSEVLAEETISLPNDPSLTNPEVDLISEKISRFVEKR